MTEFTLGSDPEFIILNGKGRVISAEGLVGEGLKDLGDGFSVHEDNILLEMNVPPARNASAFMVYTRTAINKLKDFLRDIDSGYRISGAASALYPAKYLDTTQAKTVGCVPDFDAWECKVNETPSLAKSKRRTAGGHIHIGWENPSDEERIMLTRLLDLTLAPRLSRIESAASRNRRKLYGKLGAHRPKEYGVEYRVPSNDWLLKQKEQVIWNGVSNAFALLPRADDVMEHIGQDNVKALCERCLLSGDAVAAEQLNTSVAILCDQYGVHE